MAGGLLNIISIGNNNIILTGNPTKTFFKAVYSKYTNFGLQKFRIDYDGIRDLRLTEPSTFSFKIPRYAELLMDTYIVITLPNIWSPIYPPDLTVNRNQWSPYEFRWIKDLGTMMIKEITITCGSYTIQKYSGEYLAAMVERDFSSEKKELFNRMTGNVVELNDPGNSNTRINSYPNAYPNITSDNFLNPVGAEPSIRGRNLYIPINTWFTLDNRCAFPLISLQYNELYINVTFRPIQELFQVRDITDQLNHFPYIQPDFNQSVFQMYRFLQTPPSENIDTASYQNFGNMNTIWNADIHLMSTYCFLSKEEATLFASDEQLYLIKDVFQYNFDNIAGSNRVDLTSSGMIANWMFYFQRNDVNLRNEWSNYTNWAYRNIPSDVIPATNTGHKLNIGPGINPDGASTGIYCSGNFNADNQKEILLTLGILLNGDYRENTLESGIFNYIEKYTRTQSAAKDGLYCYNFCLNTSPFEYQPSGSINMSKFKDIQIEFNTYLPSIDLNKSNFQIICDGAGNIIGVNKQNWRLYEYNFNLTLFEERYNILSFIGGNCGMLLQR